jgi:hypothetical protein
MKRVESDLKQQILSLMYKLEHSENMAESKVDQVVKEIKMIMTEYDSNYDQKLNNIIK